MGFAAEFFGALGAARRPTLALASRLDVATIAKPWLLMLYQIIRGTSPTLEHALVTMTDLDEDNIFDLRFHAYLHGKRVDEMHHDSMLLEDLAHAGIDGFVATTAPPNPFVAELVGRQSYLIDFTHPAAYLGYIGLLEGFPPTLEQVTELEQRSGLPREAFRTARLHAALDVKHRHELSEVLDVAPSSYRPGILANGLRCVELQRLALEHLSKQESPNG